MNKDMIRFSTELSKERAIKISEFADKLGIKTVVVLVPYEGSLYQVEKIYHVLCFRRDYNKLFFEFYYGGGLHCVDDYKDK